MRIIIIEDEPPIADELRGILYSLLKEKIELIKMVHTFDDALRYLKNNEVDLCFLDLNLSGDNGFEILKETASSNYHTIIVSAYTENALEAFKYGVLDFVPKPVDVKRLKIALERFFGNHNGRENSTKYIVVKKRRAHKIISVSKILFFKAEGYLVDVYLKDGSKEIIEKPLNTLEQILPINFVRVHRSYIIDLDELDYYNRKEGNVYEIHLKNSVTVPMSYSKYKTVKNILDKI